MKPLFTSNPDILGGTPVFTGTRLPVAVLFENLVDGLSLDEIIDSYPTLTRANAIAALHLAQTLITSSDYHAPEK
jgi:uncharacterized protein (DUF433 family)